MCAGAGFRGEKRRSAAQAQAARALPGRAGGDRRALTPLPQADRLPASTPAESPFQPPRWAGLGARVRGPGVTAQGGGSRSEARPSPSPRPSPGPRGLRGDGGTRPEGLWTGAGGGDSRSEAGTPGPGRGMAGAGTQVRGRGLWSWAGRGGGGDSGPRRDSDPGAGLWVLGGLGWTVAVPPSRWPRGHAAPPAEPLPPAAAEGVR